VERKIKNYKDFLFKDKNGNIVIIQMPNSPLLAWAIFLVLGHLLDSANLKWLSTAFLFAWALIEIYQGTTYFRRLLGAVVLVYIIFTHFSH
jgi:hypothetical protein